MAGDHLGEVGTDVVEIDRRGDVLGHGSTSCGAIEATGVALHHRVADLRPAAGRRSRSTVASIEWCIFIDSISISCWPARTSSPAATSMVTIVPCIGEAMVTVVLGVGSSGNRR